MSDNDAVHAVRTAVAALNDGDIDGYLAGFNPACLRWVSGLDVPRTLDDMRSDIVELYGAFEPLHLGEDLLFGSPPRTTSDSTCGSVTWTARSIAQRRRSQPCASRVATQLATQTPLRRPLRRPGDVPVALVLLDPARS